MPKESKALSDVQVRKLTFKHDSNGIPKPHRYPVGGVAGLHLYCKPSGSKSWVLRVKVGDKRKDIGLGSYPSVSLKARKGIRRGNTGLSISKRHRPNSRTTGKEGCSSRQNKRNKSPLRSLHRNSSAKESKAYKTPQQVRHLSQRLRDYAFPCIGHLYHQGYQA